MKSHANIKRSLIGFVTVIFVPGVVSAAGEVPNRAAEDQSSALAVSIGTEALTGDTTYAIGGPVTYPNGVPAGERVQHFPFSELEWPLDIWLARIDATAHINPSWRINASLKKDISDPNDPMLDSDWIITGSLDVYSESSISDFDAMMLDCHVEWAFLKRRSWQLLAGIGYLYQNFSYDSQLLWQYSPSGLYPELTYYGNGSVTVAYEISYSMPYLLIGAQLSIAPGFSIAGNISYSPLVEAEDEDFHVASYKTSVGDMDGDAFMIDISGTYNFANSWFMEAGFNYMMIDVEGDQQQLSGQVVVYAVHEESESEQKSAYLNIGYRF